MRPATLDARSSALRARLIEGQVRLAAAEQPLAVLIVGAETVRTEIFWTLASWLDPRGVDVHAFDRSDIERQRKPELAVWFSALPARGRIGLYFTGWYGLAVEDYLERRIDLPKVEERMQQLEQVEEMLRRDGHRIVKLWLGTSEEDHAARLKELEDRKLERWKIARTDRLIAKRYSRWADLTALAASPGGEAAGWQVIDEADDDERQLAVTEAVARALEGERTPSPESHPPEAVEIADHLAAVDLSLTVKKKQYDKELAKLTAEVAAQFQEVREQRRGVILALEGWDAAGKGGAIKRVLAAANPRHIHAVRIAAPTPEELAHHYLWRFMRKLPELSEVAIFDRTWYGRVLVEKVEELTPADRVASAYDEIVQFESELANAGYLIVKFWLHISPEEQLRRFEDRERVEHKLHKLTDEDWRNREKRDAYTAAVNEMVTRTDREQARWHLVSAENKHWARLDVLRTVSESLSDALL